MIKFKTFLFSFFFTLTYFSFSQTNLVPNPSFETYATCPSNVGQINESIGWDSYGNSPDYYNTCSSFNVGVPNNWVGHQFPSYGNGYSGIYTYGSNYREYMGAQLNTTLLIGQKYFVTFKVNRCDNSSIFAYATNKQGVRFSTVKNSLASPAPTNNFAHVYSNSVINDSINWTTVSGSIIADSAYQYIALGNFFDDTSTGSMGSGSQLSYYYFDDICVSTDSSYAENWTGLNYSEANLNFKVYPNPIVDQLTIDFSFAFKSYDIILYNLVGEEIERKKVVKHYEQINLSSVKSGILFLKILINNQVLNYKLIKQ